MKYWWDINDRDIGIRNIGEIILTGKCEYEILVG